MRISEPRLGGGLLANLPLDRQRRLRLRRPSPIGKPDLLRPRRRRRLPVERAVHHLPHPGEPPIGPADSPLPPVRRLAARRFSETQFHLSIDHNVPFVAHEFRRGGWTKTVQPRTLFFEQLD